MKKIVEEGYYLSISPDVLYNNRYAEFVGHIPMDNIVLESDGPWSYNEQTGVPTMILDIAEHLSEERNLEKIEILNIIYKNSCKLFKEVL